MSDAESNAFEASEASEASEMSETSVKGRRDDRVADAGTFFENCKVLGIVATGLFCCFRCFRFGSGCFERTKNAVVFRMHTVPFA